MADESKKGLRSIYGRKQSVRDREDEAAGEAKREERDKMDSRAESEGMKREEDKPSPKAEKAAEGAEKASGKFLDAMQKLHKAHEAERRDFHGNMREQFRTMASRHEKAFRDLMEGFEADDAEGEDVTGTEAAAAADRAMEA